MTSSIVHHEAPSFVEAHDDRLGPKVGISLDLASANKVLSHHLPGVVCNSLSYYVRGYNNRTYLLKVSDATTSDSGAPSGETREIILRLNGRYWNHLKTEGEVAALVYVRHHCPTVPVPRVLFYGSDPTLLGTCYIALERMEGRPLDEAWPEMDHANRLKSVECVAEHLTAIRRLTFDRIGNFGIRFKEVPDTVPLLEDIFVGGLVDGESERETGPFLSYREFFRSGLETALDKFLTHKIFKPYSPLLEHRLKRFLKSPLLTKQTKMATSVDVTRKPFYENDNSEINVLKNGAATNDVTQLHLVLADHEPAFVLTHYDLEPRNLLVNETDGTVTAILDWEFAGSFPEHQEWMISLEFLEANSAESLIAKLLAIGRPETAKAEVREDDKEKGRERLDELRGHFLARLQQLGCPTPTGSEMSPYHETRTELHLLVDCVAPWFLLGEEQDLPADADEELAKCSTVVDMILSKFGY